jgi:hypothetical protein
MKRFFPVLFLLISLISFHCQRELSFNEDNSNSNPFPVTATLQGNILDESGQPASGVTIKVGNKTTTTNAKGYFRIVNASLDKKSSLVTADKTGYFKAYRTFSATSGVNQVVIKLIPKNLSGTINSSSGGEVTLANGSKISLPANGVVSATGGNYSGVINVYASYIDPTAQDISQTIPGSLTANDKDNRRVVLNSYGMVAVELQSSSGEKLQIASGNEATLTMPVPSSVQSTAPASISLWYVDEQTGIWKEEGIATKNGNNYVGQVKHFSFWNCDVSATAILLSMTLHTPDGDPLVHAEIKLTRPNGSSSYGWTDSLGQVSGHVPSNEALAMEVLASWPCYNAIYSQNIGPFTQNTNLGVITISNGTSGGIVTVHGKLLNCTGASVTNGYAIVYYDNMVRYAATNNNGDFSTNFTVCTSSPTTCDVLGVDNAAQQQGALTTINIAVPSTNAGNLSACGNSAVQYMNYTLDGTNYTISSNVPDSFSSYTYSQGTASNFTWMEGVHSSNVYLGFDFNHNGSTGSFPLFGLSVNNLDSSFVITPFNINVTNSAQSVGQFYEGNFTGQFKNYSTGNVIHNISCSFKVRR